MAQVQAERERTRERVFRLIVENGPISTGELARITVLTAAAVRRHITALEKEGRIAVYRENGPGAGTGKRGRPARRYIATGNTLQKRFGRSAENVALSALDFIAEKLGKAGLQAYADARTKAIIQRYGEAVETAGEDMRHKLQALARALTHDGYAASVRSVPGTQMLQLCQGHCPIRKIAGEHEILCGAETRAFGEILGVHVQRIATQVSGSFTCTLTVPAGPTGTKQQDVKCE
ncbi:transcriptional regulator [Actinobaculum suis]|uniref:helix-turn-helix transcriptional regulator n=1 Tax=Actinobaculum suis TaxID=1657 RepID=UPI00066FEBED|nr:winged helix-turn-helix transcriptional regulator [Actinobaculum suis]KMY22641.1 transcriptional regulator [Actinobaculum suis]